MAGGERGGGVEKGVRQRARDFVGVQVIGTGHDVTLMRLEPLMIVGRDPEAEYVYGLRFLGEPRRQFLGNENARLVQDLRDTRDRIVIGDRDEVHSPPFGQLVDLLGRGCAFGQRHRALNLEPCKLGRGRVTVKVDLRFTRRLVWVMFHSGAWTGGNLFFFMAPAWDHDVNVR